MTMTSDARSALSRVNFRECYVMQETADLFVADVLRFHQLTPEQAAIEEEKQFVALESAYGYGHTPSADRKPFVYQDGFAIIPVHGALLNRFGGSYSFATGYNYIRRTMMAALEDEDVKVLVFDINSPGGEAAGCMELAEDIREARAVKPSIAVVDSLAASSGYAIPSACTHMAATPSSKIGSIGVYRMHVNMSGALEKMGVEITFIEAPEGGQKTAGNPFAALSEEAKKDWQAQVNMAYDDFVALVAANRGIDEDSVRETQARVFRADEALALRLIDAVKTPSEAVASFMAELADEEDSSEEDEDEMANQQTKTGAEATSVLPAAPAAVATAPAPVIDQAAIQAAIAADRTRMSEIKSLPEATSRPRLADKLALDGLSVDQAKGILAVAGEETAPAGKPEGDKTGAQDGVDQVNHFGDAMDKSKQPDVGAGAERGKPAAGGEGAEELSPADQAAALLADHAAMTGFTYDTGNKAA